MARIHECNESDDSGTIGYYTVTNDERPVGRRNASTQWLAVARWSSSARCRSDPRALTKFCMARHFAIAFDRRSHRAAVDQQMPDADFAAVLRSARSACNLEPLSNCPVVLVVQGAEPEEGPITDDMLIGFAIVEVAGATLLCRHGTGFRRSDVAARFADLPDAVEPLERIREAIKEAQSQIAATNHAESGRVAAACRSCRFAIGDRPRDCMIRSTASDRRYRCVQIRLDTRRRRIEEHSSCKANSFAHLHVEIDTSNSWTMSRCSRRTCELGLQPIKPRSIPIRLPKFGDRVTDLCFQKSSQWKPPREARPAGDRATSVEKSTTKKHIDDTTSDQTAGRRGQVA